MTNINGDISTIAPATFVPRWAVILFAVAAAMQLIDGLSTLPSLGGVVLAGLAAAALYFIAAGRTQYALFAMAVILLAAWIGALASADPATGGTDSFSTLFLFFSLPLIAVVVAVLAWRGTRLTFATVLASLPTLLSVLAAFLLGALMA